MDPVHTQLDLLLRVKDVVGRLQQHIVQILHVLGVLQDLLLRLLNTNRLLGLFTNRPRNILDHLLDAVGTLLDA